MNALLLTETIDQDEVLKTQIERLTQKAIVDALAGVHVAAAKVCPVTVVKLSAGRLQAVLFAGNQRISWEGPSQVWVAAVKAKFAERKRLEQMMSGAELEAGD